MQLSNINLTNDGLPVFIGTSYSCSDFLKELSKGKTLQEIVRDRGLYRPDLKKFLEEMSVWFKNKKNFEGV